MTDLDGSPEAPRPDAELRQLTVMFCDMVGSTDISRRNDPETYRTIVGQYHAVCRSVIEERYGGHVAQYLGDGVLALFGHPTAHEDDVRRAVKAGLDLTEDMAPVATEVAARHDEVLAIRVAVHNGPVYLELGSDGVYGENPNLTARLQDLAEPGTVVISDAVFDLVGDLFEVDTESPVPIKGFEEPVRYHVVVAEAPETARRGRRWSAPFVGRGPELARLQQVWGEASTGNGPRAALVLGEAGIGKSRLVAEFRARSEQAGHAPVDLVCSALPRSGRSDAPPAAGAFQPVRDLLERRCDIERDASGTRRLARLRTHLDEVGLPGDELVPLLAPVLGIPEGAGYEPVPFDARRLHEAIAAGVARWLAHDAGGRPVLVVVEDLHWADASTIDVLSRLVAESPAGVFALLTCRASEDGWSVGDQWGTDLVERIELGPLSAAEVELFVRGESWDPSLGDDDRRAIADRSDGVPLYLEELLLSWAEPAAASGQAGDQLRSGQSAVPAVLHEPLLARLHAPGTDVVLAQVAASIGTEFDVGLLSEAAGRSPDDARAGADQLVERRLIEVAARGDTYRFRHALVRDLAYDLQPRAERRDVHGRIADALLAGHEAGSVTEWGTIAEHLELAERLEEALDAHDRAAADERRRGSIAGARIHLERALALLRRLALSPEAARSREITLRLRRAFLVVSAEGNAAPVAVADYERCVQLSQLAEGGPELFRSLVAVWGYLASSGRLDQAEAVLTQLRELAERERPDLLAENLGGFGMIQFWRGRCDDSRETMELAVDQAVNVEAWGTLDETWRLPNDPRVSMYTHLAVAQWFNGAEAAAAENGRLALERGESLEFPQGPFSVAYAHAYLAWIETESGRFDDAEGRLDALSVISLEHGFDFWTITADLHRAIVAARRLVASGNVDADSLAGYAQTAASYGALWDALGTEVFLPYVWTSAADLLDRAGDRDTPATLLDTSLAVAERTGSHFYDAETLRIRARVEDERGLTARLQGAVELARTQGMAVLELRAALDLAEVDGDAGQPAVRAAAARFAAGSSYPELARARTVLDAS